MSGAVHLPLDLPELDVAVAGGARLRRTVLPSGVRILSEAVPGAQSATAGFWVAVGSRDEQPITYGSTHFLEHLLFKGTGERSALDIASAFDAVGGEHNALTAKEHTCYYAKVRDRDLPLAVEILADMFTSSVLDAEEFESERGVILEELAMADDDPADVVGERFFEAVFGEHPLGRPIGGYPATIQAVGRDAVLGHYRENYRPQDLVVTVAGAVDHDALVALVESALARAGWDPRADGAPVPRRDAAAPLLAAGSSPRVVERPNEQVALMLGVPALRAGDERRATLSVLNSVLGGGMSSRLFQEVREKRGLAYSVYSFASAYSDAGLMGLSAGCSPRNAGRVAELMWSEFLRLADGGITPDELARAQGQLGGASALALEDSDARMSRLGRAELTLGEFVDLDETVARVGAVTVEHVTALAHELVAGPLSVAAVGAVDAADLGGLGGAAAA
ncbi:MAG: insulinase family protein [Actinomycetales bacterium]|nr:insulinase family protein [Actinomycetales bacterium]